MSPRTFRAAITASLFALCVCASLPAQADAPFRSWSLSYQSANDAKGVKLQFQGANEILDTAWDIRFLGGGSSILYLGVNYGVGAYVGVPFKDLYPPLSQLHLQGGLMGVLGAGVDAAHLGPDAHIGLRLNIRARYGPVLLNIAIDKEFHPGLTGFQRTTNEVYDGYSRYYSYPSDWWMPWVFSIGLGYAWD